MDNAASGITGLLGLVIIGVVIVLSLAWLILPFIIISKANQMITILKATGQVLNEIKVYQKFSYHAQNKQNQAVENPPVEEQV